MACLKPHATGESVPARARAATALEQFLSTSPTLAPRDLSALLELLRELLTGLGDPLSSPDAQTYLSAQNPGGKANKLIQNLLRLEAKADATKPDPTLQALSVRIERAERWASLKSNVTCPICLKRIQ